MDRLYYDLHIHSCLSPCGDDDMTPANIVNMAVLKELDVIAITDHNSSKNCPSAIEFAKGSDLIVIPGMELCTIEEVHVLCLFSNIDNAMRFDEYVYTKLIKVSNNEDIFGKQEIYDKKDCICGIEPYLLINATEISFQSIGRLMLEYGGIAIPAHIDKATNSLISNLGFIPNEADFIWVEVTNKEEFNQLCVVNPYLNNCSILYNSDAHSLGLINEREHYLPSKGRTAEDIINSLKTHLL